MLFMLLNNHYEGYLRISTSMFKTILNTCKEWSKDYNAVQNELNKMGLFTAYHQWGAYVHYVEPTITTHINNIDDKQDTISTKN
jgi:hypothetical protein